ncbi:MAG: hypothetical protein DDT36_01700 [Firmicutes bacterium]|nr:hypothetical protein [Bacillota bacterium]
MSGFLPLSGRLQPVFSQQIVPVGNQIRERFLLFSFPGNVILDLRVVINMV